MTITASNDINSLYNVSSDAIQKSVTSLLGETSVETEESFDSILNAAISNINETNNYISDYENEELKFAMGITENSHDLTIAAQKAETALQYTLAVRDKLLTAYNEIMAMQI